MFAAALLGGQVFAEPTGTAVEGYDESVSSSTNYYGKYTNDSSTATGGNVTVKAEPTGQVPTAALIYGGQANAGGASNNKVTMQGGTVKSIYGGNGNAGASNNTVTMQGGTVSNFIYGGIGGTEGGASNNTVIMTGGSVKTLYGGSGGTNYSASDNVVIVTGGTVTTSLSVGYANGGAQNNKLHLVGKGASNVNIADAQGNSVAYDGDSGGINLANVFGSYVTTGTSTGNSIDIYGTGIKISGMLSRMQVLTFNIADVQMSGASPEAALILTSTATSAALNLTGVDLQIKDLDVQEWTPGETITLVQASQAIQGLESGSVVDIKRGDQVVALGQLELSDDNKILSLTVQGKVPEPTTGSLSLLALAGLAARRRKK